MATLGDICEPVLLAFSMLCENKPENIVPVLKNLMVDMDNTRLVIHSNVHLKVKDDDMGVSSAFSELTLLKEKSNILTTGEILAQLLINKFCNILQSKELLPCSDVTTILHSVEDKSTNHCKVEGSVMNESFLEYTAEESDETNSMLNVGLPSVINDSHLDGRETANLHAVEQTKNIIQCHICSTECTSLKDLLAHTSGTHQLKDLQCDVCNKVCKSLGNLSYHRRVHFNKPKYVCKVCGRNCQRRAFLEDHMRVHTKDKPFSCGVCNKKFARFNNMREHNKTHLRIKAGDESLPSCAVCWLVFDNTGSLNNHLKDSHNMRKNDPVIEVIEKEVQPGVDIITDNSLSTNTDRQVEDLNITSTDNDTQCDTAGETISSLNPARTSVRLRGKRIKSTETAVRIDNIYDYVEKYESELADSKSEESDAGPSPIVEDKISDLKSDGAIKRGDVSARYNIGRTRTASPDKETKSSMYKCPICQDLFTTSKALMQHKKLKHNEENNTCDICERSFPSQANLQNHLKTHKKSGSVVQVKCKRCGVECKSEKLLNRHMLSHDDYRPHVCEVCGRAFKTKGNLSYHRQSHDTERRPKYACTFCGKDCKKRAFLEVHTRIHLNQKPFTCDICRRPARSMNALKEHNKIHLKSPDVSSYVTCVLCGLFFHNMDGMSQHMEEAHQYKVIPKEDQTTSMESDEKVLGAISVEKHTTSAQQTSNNVTPEEAPRDNSVIETDKTSSLSPQTNTLTLISTKTDGKQLDLHPCSQCGLVFKNAGNLAMHMRKHSGLGDGASKHMCPICGLKCTRPSQLENHMRVHTGEKPHECSECGARFRIIQALRKHRRIHTGETFMCEVCGKSYLDGSSLKNHLKTHTGQGMHACKICGKTYLQMSGLKKHMYNHTGERPFVCEQCGQGFKDRFSLNVHTKLHTGDLEFPCDFCEQKFPTRARLTVHRRRHTGEKPWRCEECGERFRLSSLLKTHKLKHSGERPFVCLSCGKSYLTKTALVEHEKSHSDVEHKCAMCQKYFKSESKLRNHQKVHNTPDGGATLQTIEHNLEGQLIEQSPEQQIVAGQQEIVLAILQM